MVPVSDWGTLSSVKLQRISCAALLPLAELSFWVALVVCPALFMFGRLYALSVQGNAPIRSGLFEFSLEIVSEQRFHAIVNLNLPGALIGAPLSVPAASYFRSRPGAFSMQAWHTVTLPFFCMPAWSLVGLGLDAVLKRKRLHCGFRAIGSILCAACIVLVIGILTSPPADKSDLLPFMPGAIFWAVAFGLFPMNWLLRRSGTSVDGIGGDLKRKI